MLRLMGRLGHRGLRSGASTQKVIRDVETLLEERTDVTLRTLYNHVADRLAAEFTELREKARAQVKVLAKLAEVDDLTVPADVDAEIRRKAGRVAWRSVARAAVLELLDAAKSQARPFHEAESVPTETWVKVCLDVLNRADFREDTGLEGSEIDLAVDRAATAIREWPDLDTHMPMFFRGSFLTVGATVDGVVLSEGVPMMLVAEPIESAEEQPDPLSVIFSRFQPEAGVATFALDPDFDVAVVGASDEGRFTEASADDTPILGYEVVKDTMQVGLPLAHEYAPAASAGRASSTPHPAGRVELDGELLWDPDAVEVQAVGPTVLFKPKIGDYAFRLGRSEGLFRRVQVAKDHAIDVKSIAFFIDE